MNTDELFEALKPYAPYVLWGVVSNMCFVKLLDGPGGLYEGETVREALMNALAAVEAE